MSIVEHIVTGILQPIFGFLHPAALLNVYTLAGALALTGALYLWLRARGRDRGPGDSLRVALSREVWGHPSAKLDYRYYFVNGVLGAVFIALLIASSELWAGLTGDALAALFGPASTMSDPGWGVRVAATVLVVVAADLGFWVAHWLLHRVPALWEFHKIHHSAAVLTPATVGRQHPVEEVLRANCVAAPIGVVWGGMAWGFGPGATELALWKINVLLLVYFMTWHHLRHSHVWLAFTGLAGRLFQSPAHHQIHHSEDPRHFNTNLGFALSIWDWVFGTLYVPDKREALTFGIGEETADYSTIRRLYALPFVKIARRWRGNAETPAPDPAPEPQPVPVRTR